MEVWGAGGEYTSSRAMFFLAHRQLPPRPLAQAPSCWRGERGEAARVSHGPRNSWLLRGERGARGVPWRNQGVRGWRRMDQWLGRQDDFKASSTVAPPPPPLAVVCPFQGRGEEVQAPPNIHHWHGGR